VFGLSERGASSIVDECTAVVCEHSDDVCDDVGVTEATRDLRWRRAVANESVFYALH
jgi:hypothetical protein